MYQQFSSAYNSPKVIASNDSSYYTNATASFFPNNSSSADFNYYSYNQHAANTQTAQSYIPSHWVSKPNYGWSNYYCGQTNNYNQSPSNASLTSDSFNKSFDNSSNDSNQNSSFNISHSSVQSSPQSYTFKYQVI